MNPSVVSRIEEECGLSIVKTSAVGGGCIAGASRVETTAGLFFVKSGTGPVARALDAEVHGLSLLSGRESPLVIPEVVHYSPGEPTILVMQWLNRSHASPGFWGRFGEALARLHGHSQPRFGLDRDNLLGTTPQPNQWADHWPTFFRECRLGHQERLLRGRGLWQADWNTPWKRLLGALEEDLPDLYQGAVLHGDLWSGNCMSLADGRAAVFDPAVYWGDPWVDIAMTRLFGGFPDSFYDAWEQASGATSRREVGRRMDIYNLYHLLNHLLLFGTGYARAVGAAIRSLGKG